MQQETRPDLITRIDACLPQTQCGQCGFDGCLPYATAISEEKAEINQCPPGGEQTIRDLAELLDRKEKPLNPENGQFGNLKLALIREEECIGCTKCIQACPVDAILGAGKQMHVVISDACTGCELCLPPCPVDCIDLVPAPEHPLVSGDAKIRSDHIDENRRRFQWHTQRLERDQQLKAERQRKQEAVTQAMTNTRENEPAVLQDEIQAAIARSREKSRQRRARKS